MKNETNKKVYKGCSHNLIMKKSGDLCFSGVFLNSLTLKKNNHNNSMCCNSKVTAFLNSSKIIAMMEG